MESGQQWGRGWQQRVTYTRFLPFAFLLLLLFSFRFVLLFFTVALF